ncbi:hypothetical protein EVAR_40369_1 [Eumeta japonica]|uniref:RNase H type-1 domain-containing protein n=1 Tax=Eumeta variegata TaxID=151549 RepID=A0A4C1XNI6_EUMVA|nr:hypothetical protein EVAR_40369_1 [Eumeta japonica]
MAKARVAPLKITSVPRLELQAAVIGVRLARCTEEGHDVKPDQRVFWTDSRTVLTWIKTGARAYKPFVAHRLAEIEEETKTTEWRWVPTAHNVADDATREPPADFDQAHRWFRGAKRDVALEKGRMRYRAEEHRKLTKMIQTGVRL